MNSCSWLQVVSTRGKARRFRGKLAPSGSFSRERASSALRGAKASATATPFSRRAPARRVVSGGLGLGNFLPSLLTGSKIGRAGRPACDQGARRFRCEEDVLVCSRAGGVRDSATGRRAPRQPPRACYAYNGARQRVSAAGELYRKRRE